MFAAAAPLLAKSAANTPPAAMATTPDTFAPNLKIVRDATCTACGCACDDIDLAVRDGQIVEARRACSLGESWFRTQPVDGRPSCHIAGQPATIAEGIARAAEILAAARYPLVYGLSETTCEAQRVAVAVGDRIGANVDSTTSHRHGPSGVSFQGVGEVTSSLGEVANRGDLIICWGCDPAVSHPRHFARYSLQPKGMFLPGGRADRTCVVVDVRRTASADEADVFLELQPGADFEALWIFARWPPECRSTPGAVQAETGVTLDAWQDLIARMKRARFGVMLFGTGIAMTRGKYLNSEALLALVRDMNAHTRFVALPMRGAGNVAGADNVVTWQTGAHPSA